MKKVKYTGKKSTASIRKALVVHS